MRQVVSHDEQVLFLDTLPWLFLVDLSALLQIPVFEFNDIIIQFLVLYLNKHRHFPLLIFAIIEQFFNGHEVVLISSLRLWNSSCL